MESSLQLIDVGSPLHAEELDLRFRVLRAPLGMGRETATLPNESHCLHLVALNAGGVIGCVLYSADTDTAGRLRQMAVEPRLHGQGVGAALVRRLEQELIARGVRRVTLHARWPAIGFYEKLGYLGEGEPFTEVGIAHRAMSKGLVGHRAPD